MTIASIIAFLSFLSAFAVPQPTIDQIQAILMPAATTTVAYVPIIQSPIVENQPVYFGSTAPTTQLAPEATNPQPVTATPVVVLPVVEPLNITNVEISKGGYLRIFTNKPITTTVSAGSLGEALIDNYLKPDGSKYPGYVYEYKLTGARPFTVTMTDADGQSVTRSMQ